MKKAGQWLIRPEMLFLLLAAMSGGVCITLLPPLAGTDEYFHFQRIASIAYGVWQNAPVQLPNGIAQLMQNTAQFMQENTLLPYSYAHAEQLAAIPPGIEPLITMQPNYMTIHSPANYLPQALALRLGALAGLTPLQLLYLTRGAALLTGITLTFFALKIFAQGRYTLAAIALLPPLAFYRVCLSADTVTTGVGFLYLAWMLRELSAGEKLPRSRIFGLCLLGAWLGACKLPYTAATLLWLVMPKERFATAHSRITACVLGILPGVALGLWWMWQTRQGIFVGLQYETWGGKANPDAQTAYMLSDPLGFLSILLHTLSEPAFYVDNYKEMFGHFGTAQQTDVSFYLIMSLLLLMVWCSDPSKSLNPPLKAKLMALPIFGLFMLLTLTALYIHWNGVAAPIIKGFQGRYLYPLMPLLLTCLPQWRRAGSAMVPALALSLLAVVGILSSATLLLAHWK